MKKGYLKFSDERNKKFSIKTEITGESGEKTVSKQAVYAEGKAHLEHIYQSQKKLKQYYPDVEICRAWLLDYKLEFEFVQGELLLDCYATAVKNGDIAEYEKLLQYHKNIICGNESNQCTFEKSEEFEAWFGDSDAYQGTKGMVYSNFDAIAGNVIIRDNKPVFIDYEWTMDFVMPQDLVVYHCVYDAYLHHPEFESFYPFEKVLKYLCITADVRQLETSYKHFFDYVVSDADGRSYSKDKYRCLKIAHKTEHILKEWQHCAEAWKSAVEANDRLQEELAYTKKEWEKCADEWKYAAETNESLHEELKRVCDECTKNADKIIDLSTRYSKLQEQYDAIVNSNWWKFGNKIKVVK